MRSIWKGSISFGLVNIAVKLYSATEEKDVAFHQVHREDGGRIRYKRVCSVCGEEVAYNDIAKGYELPDGEIVVLTDDDLAELPLTTSREIDVLQFVPLEQVDPIYFIPQGTPLNVQLAKFQRNKERIGLIVDEYGDIQGLITLDDILEEIVGDFTTSMTPTPSDEIHPQPDGSFLVEGSASIRELNKEMDWHLPTDGPRTLNGVILEYLEEIPQPNISVRLAGYPIEILEVENNMVKMARIMPHLYRNDSGYED